MEEEPPRGHLTSRHISSISPGIKSQPGRPLSPLLLLPPSQGLRPAQGRAGRLTPSLLRSTKQFQR